MNKIFIQAPYTMGKFDYNLNSYLLTISYYSRVSYPKRTGPLDEITT